jgi:hypothetical protein
MALIPRRNPLTSLLNFAADRDREANSIGSVITQLAGPALGQMGVKTEEQPQAAVMRGPVPTAQPLGAVTGPAMAPTPVDFNPRSVELLGAADPRLRDVLTETEKRARERGIEIQVSETKRDANRQAEMVAQGKSQTMNSRHLTGNAADIFIQNPDGSANWDFEAYGPVAAIAKEVAAEKGYDDLVWGGDWKTLKDGVHFQMGGAVVAGGAGSASAGAGGGTMGGNVEDILAQLYPQMSPEDEKRQRRKDFFAAASQGLSALSQGRPIDFSNIQANQEARKRQSVLDMRERERARAAATLVLDQGGSPAMATALATGAASMGDFMTDRQIARAEKEADRQKLLAATRMDLLSPVLGELGIPEDRIAEIVAYGKEGGDVTEILTQTQAVAAAEKLREQEADQDELIATYAASQDPMQQEIARLVTGGLPLKDAVDAAAKLLPQAGGKEFADIARAQAIVDAGVPNPANNGQPFATVGEVLGFEMMQKQATGAGPQATVTYNPDGSMTITPPALAPAGVAPAQAAVTTAAPAAVGAPTGVAGAFNQQFGGMGTGIPTGAPAVAAQALPLDVAQDVATLESTMAQTAQRKQDLELALETAPDDIARAAIEADLAAVNLEQAQLNLQTAQSSAEPDAALKALSVQKAEEDLIAAELENEERRRKMAGTEDEAATEEEKAVRRELRAMQSTDTVMREGTKLLDLTKDWKSGVVPGLLATGARLLSQSETGRAERLMAGIKDNIALDNLIAMKQDSPTGGALGSVSNAEGERLENRFGSLDVTGNTTDLRDNVGAAMNAYNDAIHGTPAQILELYENGEITAEQADAYSTRLVSSLDKDTATLMTENGPATNLGLSTNRDTIYGLAKSVTGEEPGLTQEERDLFETFKQ